jgi:hypothetical protein
MAPVTVTLAGGGSGDPSTMVIMAWHLGTCESVARCLGGLSTCEYGGSGVCGDGKPVTYGFDTLAPVSL